MIPTMMMSEIPLPRSLVRNLLTEPHDEHGAGGKYHYRADLEQEVVGPEDECLARELVVKIGDIGRTLQQEHDGW